MIMSTSIEHHRILVNGVKLHYLKAGRGEPVVLLHGCPQTSYAWRHIIPALAEHYTVIAPDLRGLGDSSKPDSGYDKQTVAEDIYQLVQALNFERIFLVGHDIGATVAYAYAAAHPQDVRRLVMLESGPNFDAMLLDFSRSVGLWHVPFHMAPDIPEMLVTGKERAYLSQFYALAYNPSAITEADIDEYLRCYTAPGGLRSYFSYYRALPEDNQHVEESSKSKLTMPVLAFGGETSLSGLVMQFMQRVAQDVRGGVIEQCGHWVPEEQPQYLVQQLLTFFQEENKS